MNTSTHRRSSALHLGLTALMLLLAGGDQPVHAQSLPGLGNLGNLIKPRETQKSASPATPQNQGAQTPAKQGLPGALGAAIVQATAQQSTEEEIEIGEGVAARVLGAAPLSSNQKITEYINLVGRSVAQHGERKDLRWTFGLLETSSVNAFAFPGGIILVTRGLYDLLETEDELAAVLAHEIAHVNRQHHYNVIKKQKLVETGAGALQSQVAGGRGNELAGRMVGLGAELIARGLDKDSEFEADRDGMVLAARAGYDSSALVSVLGKLQARSRTDGALDLLFKTHPSPAERVQALSVLISPELEAAAVTSPASQRIQSYRR